MFTDPGLNIRLTPDGIFYVVDLVYAIRVGNIYNHADKSRSSGLFVLTITQEKTHCIIKTDNRWAVGGNYLANLR